MKKNGASDENGVDGGSSREAVLAKRQEARASSEGINLHLLIVAACSESGSHGDKVPLRSHHLAIHFNPFSQHFSKCSLIFILSLFILRP